MTNYILVALGFAILFVGGDFLVRGAVSLARKLKVSTLLIAVTIVAFGTSLPELIVNIEAAISGSPSLAIGNVIGSNIANILLVLGLPAIVYPIVTNVTGIGKDVFIMLLASLLLTILAVNGILGRFQGIFLFTLLILFLAYSYWKGKQHQGNNQTIETEISHFDSKRQKTWIIASEIVGGFGGLFIGSKLLIEGAVGIAVSYAIPEEVIGLTLVAFGTSLPELVTSGVAAIRRQGDLVIGNVIGSNIFNTLGVAGLTAMIIPLPVSERMLSFDFLVMIGGVILLLPFILLKRKIGSLAGLTFFIAYLGYVWSQFTGISGIPIG